MIRINEDWGIDVSDCYALMKIYINKKGEEVSTPVGYFTSLEGALKRLRKEIVKGELKSRDMRLSEALNTIREFDDKIEKLIRAATRGY